VFDKAIAAEKSNISLFLVPYGQERIIYYEPRVEERAIVGFSFTRVYYTPKEIELDKYMEGKMAVEEVATIGEAALNMIV
jgi:predicted S18 family serine protease